MSAQSTCTASPHNRHRKSSKLRVETLDAELPAAHASLLLTNRLPPGEIKRPSFAATQEPAVEEPLPNSRRLKSRKLRECISALQLQARPGAQQAARPAVLLVRHGGVAGGAAALGRLSGRRVAGFCAAWWWDIIFQAARTILVIVCAVQCGSSRHHGLPAMRKSKSKSRRRPLTHAVSSEPINAQK